jgi:hypothetical protein
MRRHRPAVPLPVKIAVLVALCACAPVLNASGARADHSGHGRAESPRATGGRSAHKRAETSAGATVVGVRVLPVPTPTPTSPPPYHGHPPYHEHPPYHGHPPYHEHPPYHGHLPFTGFGVIGAALAGSAAVLSGTALLWLSSIRRRRAIRQSAS